MRHPITPRLFHQPLRSNETFGMVFWKDEYSEEVDYTLGIAYGNDRENILDTYEEDYKPLISIISLRREEEYENEDKDEENPDNILQVSLWSIRPSNISVPRTSLFIRNTEHHFAIRCRVYNGKQTIEVIINGKNVGVYEENIGSDCFVYPAIIHKSSSTGVLVYRYGDIQSLQKLCREVILQRVNKELFDTPGHAIPLPLPAGIKYYLQDGVNPNELEYMEKIGTTRNFLSCKRFENKDGRYGPILGYYGILL